MDIAIVTLPGEYSILKLDSLPDVRALTGFFALTRTDDEISLICASREAAALAPLRRDDGYGLLRVAGQLDFALIGILSRLTDALARSEIPVCAVSTFDTDYLLIKQRHMARALAALTGAGCRLDG
jgi:hypothetical protein